MNSLHEQKNTMYSELLSLLGEHWPLALVLLALSGVGLSACVGSRSRRVAPMARNSPGAGTSPTPTKVTPISKKAIPVSKKAIPVSKKAIKMSSKAPSKRRYKPKRIRPEATYIDPIKSTLFGGKKIPFPPTQRSLRHHIYFWTRSDNSRVVYRHDLRTGVTQRLLGGQGDKAARAIGISPSHRVLAVLHPAGRREKIVFYRTDTPKLTPLRVLSGRYHQPQFFNDHKIFVGEHLHNLKPERVHTFQLSTIDLRSGQKELVKRFLSREMFFDDAMPLLSPDRRWLTYFVFQRPMGGRLMDLKSKKVFPFPEHSIIQWSSDSRHVFTFCKENFRTKKSPLGLFRLQANGTFTMVKSFGLTAVTGQWLGDKRHLLIGEFNRTERRLTAHIYDQKTNKKWLLSSKIPMDEMWFPIYYAIPLKGSREFVWIERDGPKGKQEMRLMHGVRRGNAWKRKVLFRTPHMLAFPRPRW